MAAKLGSFRHSFQEKKQRLLSESQTEGYTEIGYGSSSMESIDGETKCQCCHSLGHSIAKSWNGLQMFLTRGWEFGRSDPRRVIFSGKVGLALVVITLLMYYHIPSKKLDKNYAWAILTVVLVSEFSVGATLSKGFNRGLGTLSAGGLALGIADISITSGRWEEVVIIISIFITGTCTTYVKLYPMMKNYEYGFRVFLLTYCFILASGETELKQFLNTAELRFLLILLGAAVSMVVNICIYPIWAGEDLHNLVVKNFTSVATSLEGCVKGYLQCVEYERIPSKVLSYQAANGPLYISYMSAVESKNQEETLESFAAWEPPHGRYKMFKYPWKNYVKLSAALRHCAFIVSSLHGCLLSEIQAPPERRQVFSSELQRVGNEGTKVLRELGEKVKKMEKLEHGDDILLQVHEAAEELQLQINQKSYLLVNSESWVIGRRRNDLENIEEVKDNESNSLAFKSLSETVLNFRSDALSRHWHNHNTDRSGESFVPTGASPESMFEEQRAWPQHQSFIFDTVFSGEESKAYESASALSLATFASLLIEFVARLQNLVEIFEELSEVANFMEPKDDSMGEKEIVGFWTRLIRCFCCNN